MSQALILNWFAWPNGGNADARMLLTEDCPPPLIDNLTLLSRTSAHRPSQLKHHKFRVGGCTVKVYPRKRPLQLRSYIAAMRYQIDLHRRFARSRTSPRPARECKL